MTAGYEVLLKWAKSLRTSVCHGHCGLVHPVWWARKYIGWCFRREHRRDTDALRWCWFDLSFACFCSGTANNSEHQASKRAIHLCVHKESRTMFGPPTLMACFKRLAFLQRPSWHVMATCITCSVARIGERCLVDLLGVVVHEEVKSSHFQINFQYIRPVISVTILVWCTEWQSHD